MACVYFGGQTTSSSRVVEQNQGCRNDLLSPNVSAMGIHPEGNN